MLLRHKKTSGEEQNWCVILSPLRSELDKKRVAQKIASIFALSAEEAADLVANTPIILLDNLTKSVAGQVRDYLRGAGAEILLTNDVLQKRKCYRTVWPDPPNLSFLHGWQPAVKQEPQEALAPDDAVHEIRSLSQDTPVIDFQESGLKFSDFSNSGRQDMDEETEKLRQENQNLQEQLRHFKEELRKAQEQARRETLQDSQKNILEKEKEIKEVRMLLLNAEEKYQVLREEYREARGIYEEKIGLLTGEMDQARKKIQELNAWTQTFQKEKLAATQSLQEKDIQIQKERDEAAKESRLHDQKMLSVARELDGMRLRIKDLEEKLVTFQKNKEELETSLNEQSEQITYWSGKYRTLSEEHEKLKVSRSDEALLRQKAEELLRETQKSQSLLSQEAELRTAEIRNWNQKCLLLEKQLLELQEAWQNQDKVLNATLLQLETREKELESARKQLRDIHAQVEHRETTQRRTRLAQELQEKEAMLKSMVASQEKIENEIRDREESIRKIIADQEKIEKEIMEAKQSQRHLAELAKRDSKPGRFKNGGKEKDEPSLEDFPE